MKNLRLKIALVLTAALSLLIFTPALSYAACDASTPSGAIQCGSCNATGNTNCTATANTSVNNTVKTVIQVLSLLVGVVAVIMVIIGGFRYITSGGDSNKTAAAKNTLLYALVGLAIAMLAQLIVNFVLFKSTKV